MSNDIWDISSFTSRGPSQRLQQTGKLRIVFNKPYKSGGWLESLKTDYVVNWADILNNYSTGRLYASQGSAAQQRPRVTATLHGRTTLAVAYDEVTHPAAEKKPKTPVEEFRQRREAIRAAGRKHTQKRNEWWNR